MVVDKAAAADVEEARRAVDDLEVIERWAAVRKIRRPRSDEVAIFLLMISL